MIAIVVLVLIGFTVSMAVQGRGGSCRGGASLLAGFSSRTGLGQEGPGRGCLAGHFQRSVPPDR